MNKKQITLDYINSLIRKKEITLLFTIKYTNEYFNLKKEINCLKISKTLINKEVKI
jgi:hypothetical protein